MEELPTATYRDFQLFSMEYRDKQIINTMINKKLKPSFVEILMSNNILNTVFFIYYMIIQEMMYVGKV